MSFTGYFITPAANLPRIERGSAVAVVEGVVDGDVSLLILPSEVIRNRRTRSSFSNGPCFIVCMPAAAMCDR